LVGCLIIVISIKRKAGLVSSDLLAVRREIVRIELLPDLTTVSNTLI
jgi:hypothetical protein